jgi:hypothetical protein
MPTRRAPSFSFATARIALPVSVRASASQRMRVVARAAAKPIRRGFAISSGPSSTVWKPYSVDSPGVGAKDREQRVLDRDREPQRDEEDVAVVAAARRPDHEALEHVAETEEQRRQQRDGEVRVKPECRVRHPDREHGASEQRSMGEVDDVQHAVDQGQVERDEGIDGAGQEAVHDGLGHDRGGVHGQLPRCLRGARRDDARTLAGSRSGRG